MLTYPRLRAQDLFWFSATDPLENLLDLQVYLDQAEVIADPPAYVSIITSGTPSCLVLSNADAPAQPTTVTWPVSTAGAAISLDFQLESTILPSVISSGRYVRVSLRHASAEVSVGFTTKGPTIWFGANQQQLEDLEEYAAGIHTFRLVLDGTAAELHHHNDDGSFTMLASWTASGAGGSSRVEVACFGTAAAPTSCTLYELHAMDGAFTPGQVIAVLGGPEEGRVGELLEFTGADSQIPGGGPLTFFWTLVRPAASASAFAGATAAYAELPGAGGGVVRFTLQDPGIPGNRWFLHLNATPPGGTIHVSWDEDARTILLEYPTGTTTAVLHNALTSPANPAYNAAVAAFITMTYTAATMPAPAPESYWNFGAGAAVSAATASFLPDTKGSYTVRMYLCSDKEVWRRDLAVVAVNPETMIFGDSPDTSFLLENISSWWGSIRNRDKFETTWKGLAAVAAADLVDVYQTSLTLRMNQIPRFWRRRWVQLPLWIDFNAVTPEISRVPGQLVGLGEPIDDDDGDLTGFRLTSIDVEYAVAVEIRKNAMVYSAYRPSALTAWTEVPGIAAGAQIIVQNLGGPTFRVDSVETQLLTLSYISGMPFFGLASKFFVKSAAGDLFAVENPIVIEQQAQLPSAVLLNGASWADYTPAAPGTRLVIGGAIYVFTALLGNLAYIAHVDGPQFLGTASTFRLRSQPVGKAASLDRSFLADFTAVAGSAVESTCPQDAVPCRLSVDVGNNYGYVQPPTGVPTSHDLQVAFGAFSEDIIPSDVAVVKGTGHVIQAAASKVLTLADALPPATGLTWSVYRPITQLTWLSVGVATVTLDDPLNAGDLLRLTITPGATASTAGETPATAACRIVYVSGSTYYFSLWDLYQDLPLAYRRAADLWTAHTFTCAGAMRVDHLPLPEDVWDVPVLRPSLLLDTPALVDTADYICTTTEVQLTAPYSRTNLPPRNLWAENLLQYNWYAEQVYGPLTGVNLDHLAHPEWYVPATRGLLQQMLYGPWKRLFTRSIGILMGLPFAPATMKLEGIESTWYSFAAGGKTYAFELLAPPVGLELSSVVPEFQLLDTRLKLEDYVSPDKAWPTLKGWFEEARYRHAFLVVAPGEAWRDANLDAVDAYVLKNKPIWQKYLLVSTKELTAEPDLSDQVKFNLKLYLFDVPTGCEYPDSPIVQGEAHLHDDPNWTPATAVTGAATDGGLLFLEDTTKDLLALGIKKGRVLINHTKENWGWVTRVDTHRVWFDYRMHDDTITNAAGDAYTLEPGHQSIGAQLAFDRPLVLMAIAGSDAATLIITPQDGLDYRGDTVTKHLAFYGAGISWRVRNRTSGSYGTVRAVATTNVLNDTLQLHLPMVPPNAPGEEFELIPPSGVPSCKEDLLEYLGPKAYPDIKRIGVDVMGNVVAYSMVSGHKDPDTPINPGTDFFPYPVIESIMPLQGHPGDNVVIVGHFFGGVIHVYFEAEEAVQAPGSKVWNGAFWVVQVAVPSMPAGLVTVMVTDDSFMGSRWCNLFEVLEPAE